MNKLLFITFLLVVGYVMFVIAEGRDLKDVVKPATEVEKISKSLPIPSPAPKVGLLTPPSKKVLNSNYHVFQSFNNCGPAALSMALSYYGINVSQEVLGQALRPYQVPGGNNDDKSVTLEELAEKSKEYNLVPYHR